MASFEDMERVDNMGWGETRYVTPEAIEWCKPDPEIHFAVGAQVAIRRDAVTSKDKTEKYCVEVRAPQTPSKPGGMGGWYVPVDALMKAMGDGGMGL